jgi:6-phosphogluconolactonase
MNGEIRIVSDVPAAYAALIEETFVASKDARRARPFRLGASGGSSGAASFTALVHSSVIDVAAIDLYFVDERCVDPSAEESNQRAIGAVLGDQLSTLAGFHPMSCDDGGDAYDELLGNVGTLDAIQLGLGPDGHTASLFPGSEGLDAPASRFCVTNFDPSGFNPLARVTMTYRAIRMAPLVVFTVIGEARADVVRRIAAGEDLPSSRVEAEKLVWLIDEGAGSLLEGVHHE